MSADDLKGPVKGPAESEYDIQLQLCSGSSVHLILTI